MVILSNYVGVTTIHGITVYVALWYAFAFIRAPYATPHPRAAFQLNHVDIKRWTGGSVFCTHLTHSLR
jgi:hypothetical protein